MQAVIVSARLGWVVRHAFLVAVVVSCGSDRIAGTETGGAATAPVETVTATSATAPTPVAVFECFASHGVEASDPTLPGGSPPRGERYPPGVATAAWDACKELYVSAFRHLFSGSSGIVAESPSDAEPFGFGDCMAAHGWITLFGTSGEVADFADYTSDNAECRRPADGESAAASYCRLVHAIIDTSGRDRSVSLTGIPNAGGDAARGDAAVRLYEDLVEVAPSELVDDLRTLQDGFRQGSEIPEATWSRIGNYQTRICGVPVRLGSLD